MSSEPLRVVVTGAASDIGQNICYTVAQGRAFGPDRKLELVMVEKPSRIKVISEGLALELAICAQPAVVKYTCTTSLTEAFKHADFIFLCGGILPNIYGQSRDEFIGISAIEAKETAKKLKESKLKPNSKILVVSEPQNIILRVLAHFSPSTDTRCLMGLSRMDQNRATTCLARMMEVSSGQVKGLIVWGNRWRNIFIDIEHAKVEIKGKLKPAMDVVTNHHFIRNKFNDVLNNRQDDIERRRKANLCLPYAAAAVQHAKDWMAGTGNDWSSMIVFSDGSYNREKGIPFSFPVKVSSNGYWEIVQGLDLGENDMERLDQQQQEINKEWDFAATILRIRSHKAKSSEEDSDEKMPWSFNQKDAMTCKEVVALKLKAGD